MAAVDEAQGGTGRPAGAIVHDRAVIVGGAAHEPVRFRNPVVVLPATGLDVLVMNGHVLVAVPALVFVMEAQRVAQFVGERAALPHRVLGLGDADEHRVVLRIPHRQAVLVGADKTDESLGVMHTPGADRAAEVTEESPHSHAEGLVITVDRAPGGRPAEEQ